MTASPRTKPIASPKPSSSGDSNVGLAFARNATAWLDAQAELLASVQTLTQEWLDHRRQGMESARDAVQMLCNCRDPAEAFRIQQDWLASAMSLVQSDVTTLSNTVASMTKAATADFEAATRVVGDSIRQAETDIFKAAAGSKPGASRTESDAA
jgi:hypothetical protein